MAKTIGFYTERKGRGRKVHPVTARSRQSKLVVKKQKAVKGPFTPDQVDAYNRFTHFPVDINREYLEAVAAQQRAADEELKRYGVTETPRSVVDALKRYRETLKEYYLNQTRIRAYAPPPSVVGPSGYPAHRLPKAERREAKNLARLEKAESAVERAVKRAVKGKLPVEQVERWLPAAKKKSRIEFGRIYAQVVREQADPSTRHGREVRAGTWDKVNRKTGRDLWDRLLPYMSESERRAAEAKQKKRSTGKRDREIEEEAEKRAQELVEKYWAQRLGEGELK
jgi:hypothetical protein